MKFFTVGTLSICLTIQQAMATVGLSRCLLMMMLTSSSGSQMNAFPAQRTVATNVPISKRLASIGTILVWGPSPSMEMSTFQASLPEQTWFWQTHRSEFYFSGIPCHCVLTLA
jgi:hypothetical protein